MNRFRSVVFLTLVAACNEVTTPSSPPQVSLTASTVWSGGQVAVRSAAFASLSTLPVVTIGGTAVPVKRVNDSTLAATAPIATGSLPVSVKFPQATVSAGSVTLTGFTGEVTAPYMSGRAALVNPGAAGPIVFSNGDSGGVLLDLATNTVVGTLSDSITSPDCAQNPGPSYRGPGYFVLQGRPAGVCHGPWGWQVYPSLVRGDSATFAGSTQWLVMAEVGSHRWFFEYNNHVTTYDCSGGSCSSRYWLDHGGPTAVAVDPGDAHFTWFAQNYPGSGAPTVVLDAATFDTAYTMGASIGSLLSAAYSSGGDTLFSYVLDSAYGAFLLATRASDGLVQLKANVDSLGFGRVGSYNAALTVDPSNPWIYLATTLVQPDSTLAPALVVLNRGTWTVAGVALAKAASGNALDDFRFNNIAVVPDPNGHHVYVVGTPYGLNVHGVPGVILSFSTP